jgi:multidrug efflux pump subunit AcrA (membrane-fusion protein)
MSALQPPASPAVSFPPDAGSGALDSGVNTVLRGVLADFRLRLIAAGVNCRALAVVGPDAPWSQGFEPANAVPTSVPSLEQAWDHLRAQISPAQPLLMSLLGADRLIASTLQLPTRQNAVIGVCLGAPHGPALQAQLVLALGWLQLALSAQLGAQDLRAARLLELLGHVGGQSGARAGAQEWVNRTAAWLRAELPPTTSLSLSLFEMRGELPRWWVTSDLAWAAPASPGMQAERELAAAAAIELRELQRAPGWALPLLSQGEPVAVLVARCDAALPEASLAVLRASASLAEPLLSRWRVADEALPRHAWRSLRWLAARLTGPGHWVWKAGALGVAAGLAGLLLWPVPDRVNANLVIEGRTRQLLTAPFDGFVAQALVRPGHVVSVGQPMARLDDRDLKLEQSRYRSEAAQAATRLRAAMAERDAAAVAVSSAELQQAQAQLALAEARLARATLVAPLAGQVVSGDWVQKIGAPVETGKEMFEIASNDGYRVVLHVPDKDINRVRLGQHGSLRLTGQPHVSHDFVISNLTATASVEAGVNGFRVEARWDGPVPQLSPGMQGVGKIAVGESNLLTIWLRPAWDGLRLKLWAWGW